MKNKNSIGKQPNKIKSISIKKVTVAIPVFNEESNIKQLIKTILTQKGNFVLEKVLIINDGSTDKTTDIITGLSKKENRIVLRDEKIRQGKAVRLNQIFQENRSDFLVVFDGDICLANQVVIEKMLEQFHHEAIVLVSANNLPLPGESLLGKITQYSEELWYHARKNYHDGESYFNNSGCSFALRKTFAKSIALPVRAHTQLHLYYEVVKKRMSFRFAKEAVVYYKTPDTLEDIVAHHARGKTSHIIESKINLELGEVEKIPLATRLNAVITMMMKNPFYTLLTILYLQIANMLPISADPLNNKGLWTVTKSTKVLIPNH